MTLRILYRVIRCDPKFINLAYGESYHKDKNILDSADWFYTYEEAVSRIEELVKHDWCTEYFIRKVYRHAGE